MWMWQSSHPHIHWPPPHTSPWVTSISTGNRTLIHKTHKEWVSHISAFLLPLWEQQKESMWLTWSITGVCRPLSDTAAIISIKRKHWVCYLSILIHLGQILHQTVTGHRFQAEVSARLTRPPRKRGLNKTSIFQQLIASFHLPVSSVSKDRAEKNSRTWSIWGPEMRQWIKP